MAGDPAKETTEDSTAAIRGVRRVRRVIIPPMPGSPSADADPSVRLRARVVLAVGAVLAALVLREGWREVSTFRPSSAPIDERYASFIAPARGERRIGTLPDARTDADFEARRVELEYALAPAVLVPGTIGVRFVVAWSRTPDELAALATKHRLRHVARSTDGVVLFATSKP